VSLLSIRREKLPNEWKFVKIGELLNATQYGTNAANDSNGNLKIVGMKDIQNGKILITGLMTTNLPKKEKDKFLLKKGDILINRTNSYDLVGKVGLFNSNIEAVFASYLVRLVLKMDMVDPFYLNYYLNSYKAQTIIKRIATKAVSQANINPTEFKKFCEVPLPPLPEQKAIASLLSVWDEAIEKTERLIEVKERRFKWLRIELIKMYCLSWKWNSK
jgi:type I restriction enzyme S subunit